MEDTPLSEVPRDTVWQTKQNGKQLCRLAPALCSLQLSPGFSVRVSGSLSLALGRLVNGIFEFQLLECSDAPGNLGFQGDRRVCLHWLHAADRFGAGKKSLWEIREVEAVAQTDRWRKNSL